MGVYSEGSCVWTVKGREGPMNGLEGRGILVGEVHVRVEWLVVNSVVVVRRIERGGLMRLEE